MKKIRLNDADEPCTLDPAILVDTRMMLCANSGGGKSHALRLIAEQVGNQIPTIIIDPEGEWATIRTHVHAVLIGPGGDVQADPKLAKRLARRLVEVDCSAVVDLSELRSQAKRTFVREFIEGLLGAPRKFWGSRLVILDEAHKFAPETGRDAESRQAVIDLMDSGRKRGLGGILATQRLSKIAKDAVAEANNLMLGRFAQDVDLHRASDLLGFSGRSGWEGLRTLPPGRFMCLGPAFAHPGVLCVQTLSKLQTDHPKPGARHLVTPPKPSKKVLEVLAKLNDLPQEAVAEVEAQQRKAVKGGTSHGEVQLAVEAALVRERKTQEEAVAKAVKRAVADVEARYAVFHEGLRKELEAVFGKIEKTVNDHGGPIDLARYSLSRPPDPVVDQTRRSRTPRTARTSNDATGYISGAPYRLLVALLQHGTAMSRPRAALVAQLSPRSSTFRNAMSSLRNADPVLLRDLPGGDIEATEEAFAVYDGQYEPLPEGADLIRYWRGQLGGAEQRLFDVLVTEGGSPLARPDVAVRAQLSPQSSTFRNAMSKLRRLGLMNDLGRNDIALGEDLLR